MARMRRMVTARSSGVSGNVNNNFLFGFLGPFRDVSIAFAIRRGGALWRISELLGQVIFSMGPGMFFFDCNSRLLYVVLTRS